MATVNTATLWTAPSILFFREIFTDDINKFEFLNLAIIYDKKIILFTVTL